MFVRLSVLHAGVGDVLHEAAAPKGESMRLSDERIAEIEQGNLRQSIEVRDLLAERAVLVAIAEAVKAYQYDRGQGFDLPGTMLRALAAWESNDAD